MNYGKTKKGEFNLENTLDNSNFDIQQFEKWYENEMKIFEILASKVKDLIKELIDLQGIKYHSITYRIKDKESLINKVKNKQYKDPYSQIHDYIGIRVVTFVKSDVDKVCMMIEKEFNIDLDNSSNKSDELGEDKVGYRSIHYVAKVNDLRSMLTDYSYLKEKCFEIQVRTILEHAWADISHDRTYKFNGFLPEKNDIRRRFALASASLEMIDREFDRLSKEIEEYSSEVSEETEKGNLSYLIDNTSLSVYLSEKLRNEIERTIIEPTFNGVDDKVIEELYSLGIETLEQLDVNFDELLKNNYIDFLTYIKKYDIPQNFSGILRNFMMIQYGEVYFEKAWKNAWDGIPQIQALKLFELYPKLKEVLYSSPIEIY